jgi:hypothetical protein
MHRVPCGLDGLVDDLKQHLLLGVHGFGLASVDAEEVMIKCSMVPFTQVGVLYIGALLRRSVSGKPGVNNGVLCLATALTP